MCSAGCVDDVLGKIAEWLKQNYLQVKEPTKGG
jgi:hypothetical protein